MAGDSDVHGANVWLAILMSTLGVKLNRMPFLHDGPKGFLPFLDAGGAFVGTFLAELWRDENLGKSERAISRARFSRRVGDRSCTRLKNRFHPSLAGSSTAAELANRCVSGVCGLGVRGGRGRGVRRWQWGGA